jgi:uncharacterized protein
VTLLPTLHARTQASNSLYRPLSPGGSAGPRATARAIPYFLWANREAGPMRVWIPLAATGS